MISLILIRTIGFKVSVTILRISKYKCRTLASYGYLRLAKYEHFVHFLKIEIFIIWSSIDTIYIKEI